MPSSKNMDKVYDDVKKYIPRKYVSKICELWVSLKPNF